MNRRRFLRGSCAALVGVAAVGLQASRLEYSEAYGPLFVTGHLGETVHGSRLTIQAQRVVLAESVQVRVEGASKVIKAMDTFVVIRARVVANRGPTHLWTAELQTREGRYDRADTFWCCGDDTMPRRIEVPTLAQFSTVNELQPGMWRHGVFLFDVPVSVLAGSTLVVSHRDPWTPGVGRYREDPERFGAEMRIHLDLDDRQVQALVRSGPERLVVRKPRA